MNTLPASGADDAFLEGFRAGYEHGYDIGRAHGRAEVFIEHAPVPEFRVSGPTRAELLERGHIPRDLTRPPALPVHLWDAEDWLKASERDLPTTEYGRAEWRTAVAAGRVPAHLAEAFAAREDDRSAERDADASRALAHLRGRGRSHPDRPATGSYDMPRERWLAAVETLRERGHRIDTALVAGGDRGRNETGYVLRDAEADRQAEASGDVRTTVADTGRRIAAMRGRLEAGDSSRRRTADAQCQVDADVVELDEPTLGRTGSG
jgi:hypothetical protein